MRPYSEFRAHLRDPLEIGSTLVATAGTTARIVVTAKEIAKDGTPRYHISIVGLRLGVAGTLPVKPDMPVVERLTSGTAVAATTLAAVGIDNGKVRVEIPLPFQLSNDKPNGGYTPAPLRTAAPFVPHRKATPKPTSAPSPDASSSPSPVPSPTGT